MTGLGEPETGEETPDPNVQDSQQYVEQAEAEAANFRHFITMHSQKVNQNFGSYSYKHSVRHKNAVVSVGSASGQPGTGCSKPYNNMLKFWNTAEPGDYVYINGRPTKKGKNLVTHRGKYTGKVFTADLTHPAIQRLTAQGCRFEQGVIGDGLCIDHNLTCAPIYIELCDFEELPSSQKIKGPGMRQMLYEVRADLPCCQNFLNTFNA